MHFEVSGPADPESLVDALRRVAETREVYSLLLSDGLSERVFYFAIGGMRVIRGGKRQGPRLGEILVADGKLTAEQAEQVGKACAQDMERFGRVAVQMKLLSADDAQEALLNQVEEELLDMFLWDDAELRLIRGQPPKEVYERRRDSAAISVNASAIVTRVLQRVEEWNEIAGKIPTGRELFELTDRGRALAGSGPYALMVQAFDGETTINDVVDASGLPRVPAFEFAMHAVRDQQLRRVASHSSGRMPREQRMELIAELEKALEEAVDAVIVRTRLARHYEAVGEKSRAAGLWRELGDVSRSRSDFDQALSSYRECIRLLPSEFEARELILEIHQGLGDTRSFVRDGRPLAELYVKNNLLNRAKHLLMKLVAIEPDDVRLKRQLITVLIGLGERELALKYLRELARLLEAQGASDAELKDVYVRILALDPTDLGARRRLDTIQGIIHRRRIIRISAVVTVVLGSLLGYLFWEEQKAREDINLAAQQALALVEAAVQSGDEAKFDDAKKVLADAMARHPRSPSAGSLKGLHERVSALHHAHLGRTAAALEAAKRRQSYLSPEEESAAQSLRATADKLLAEGKTAEAHAVLVELMTGYALSEAVETARMPLELTVLPGDATVMLEGDEIGPGDQVVMYDPSGGALLRVERDGFEPFERLLTGSTPLRLRVALTKPVRWTFRSDAAFESAPVVVDGVCYLSGRDRRVTALRAEDGELLWCRPLGLYADVAVAPVMTPNGLVVVTALGQVVCLDPASGDERWRTDILSEVERQPLAVTQALLLVPCNDGSMHALLTSDGTESWSLPARTVSGSPVRVDDMMFVYRDARGGLTMARVQDGKAVRRTGALELMAGPVPSGDRLWSSAGDGQLRVLDPNEIGNDTHESNSGIPVAALEGRFAPEVVGEVAYVVCDNGRVTAVSLDRLTKLDIKLDKKATAKPTLYGDELYVVCEEGTLVVVSAKGDAGVLWQHEAGSPIRAAPVVDRDSVYLVTEAGHVIALAR